MWKPQTSWSDVGWPSVITAKQVIKVSGESRPKWGEKTISSKCVNLWSCLAEAITLLFHSKVTHLAYFAAIWHSFWFTPHKNMFFLPSGHFFFQMWIWMNSQNILQPSAFQRDSLFYKIWSGGFSIAKTTFAVMLGDIAERRALAIRHVLFALFFCMRQRCTSKETRMSSYFVLFGKWYQKQNGFSELKMDLYNKAESWNIKSKSNVDHVM